MGLKDQLAGTIPADLLPLVSDHFEVIGDVAVIGIPAMLEPYKRVIAEAVAAKRKNIVTVLNKTEKIAGASRTASYETVIGHNTETVHREFGFSYRIDVGRSFFSARMAYERRRVTGQVEPGEAVYVPFAGVGPFAVPAAARGAEVWAAEQNPDAFRLLQENAAMNRVGDRCHALQGDALDTALIPCRHFDRIIIPAPYGMDRALDVMLPLLSPGGMAHWYTFGPKEQVPGRIASYERKGFGITFYGSCGNVAPGISRWVFDLVRSR